MTLDENSLLLVSISLIWYSIKIEVMPICFWVLINIYLKFYRTQWEREKSEKKGAKFPSLIILREIWRNPSHVNILSTKFWSTTGACKYPSFLYRSSCCMLGSTNLWGNFHASNISSMTVPTDIKSWPRLNHSLIMVLLL